MTIVACCSLVFDVGHIYSNAAGFLFRGIVNVIIPVSMCGKVNISNVKYYYNKSGDSKDKAYGLSSITKHTLFTGLQNQCFFKCR